MRLATIDDTLFADVLARARATPRRRMNHNFHRAAGENPQRFLNVLLEGTYIQPHRHRDPPKAETFVVLEGRVAFFTFTDDGEPESVLVLDGAGPVRGVDVGPGFYHSLTALSPHAVCFEVKPGPYSALNDKEFAPWAPSEGDAAASAYLSGLLERVK